MLMFIHSSSLISVSNSGFNKIRKAFSKFYHRHSELNVKYTIGLKTPLQQDISVPIFYGDLIYKFKRIIGIPNLVISSKTLSNVI